MVTIAGAERGLSVDAMKDMEIGQVVDYVEEYNRMHDTGNGKGEKKQEEVIRRKATQQDWDNFFGV